MPCSAVILKTRIVRGLYTRVQSGTYSDGKEINGVASRMSAFCLAADEEELVAVGLSGGGAVGEGHGWMDGWMNEVICKVDVTRKVLTRGWLKKRVGVWYLVAKMQGETWNCVELDY